MIAIDKKLKQLEKQRLKELEKKSSIEDKLRRINAEIKRYQDYKKKQDRLDEMMAALEKEIADNLKENNTNAMDDEGDYKSDV